MALSAEDITKSIKEKKEDPRVKGKVKFQEAAHNPEFLKKLRGGVDYWHMLHIGDAEIPVRLLSVKETMDVMKTTQSWYLSLPETERVPMLAFKKKAMLTLIRALSSTPDSEGDHQFFIEEKTLERLEDSVFVNLFRSYADLCDRYDVSLDELTAEEYVSLVEDLKKNAAQVKDLSRLRLEQILLKLLKDVISLMDKLRTAQLQEDITTP